MRRTHCAPTSTPSNLSENSKDPAAFSRIDRTATRVERLHGYPTDRIARHHGALIQIAFRLVTQREPIAYSTFGDGATSAFVPGCQTSYSVAPPVSWVVREREGEECRRLPVEDFPPLAQG